MIDTHTHTQYSKHATGEVEELIKAAISNNIKILSITDHAPYFVDEYNRILKSELGKYIREIRFFSNKYKDDIKVLVGLEVDYHPEHNLYIYNLLKDIEIDYVIGAIHYVYINDKKINVWDIDSLLAPEFIDEYFNYLDSMIESGFFDSIAHPDTILRGGIKSKLFSDKFDPLIPKMVKNKISYEINCSSKNKDNFDPILQKNVRGDAIYPDYDLLRKLNYHNVSFTIGSDSHNIIDVGFGIKDNLLKCNSIGINEIAFYENRLRNIVKI